MGKKITLKNLGEFGFIRKIRKRVRRDKAVETGIGDDAAVLKVDAKKRLLFTTDMLIEGRHFKLSDATAFEIGWKAMAVNLSDIAAMGVRPTHAVVALGLPGDLDWVFLKELYRGMDAVARRFHVTLVGGDTNRSDKIIISVALLGEVSPGSAVKRSGARIGDVIFVTGFLGGSYVSKKHLTFLPRINEAKFLVENFKVNAMMDLSDGLASDIFQLTSESGVGAFLSKEAIPVSKDAASVERALNDGEDFELLFTLPVRDAARLSMTRVKKAMAPFHPIGKIVPKKYGVRLIGANGFNEPLERQGYDHFRK